MLEIYSHPNSTYSHRVHLCLAFKSLPYETIHVALDKLENRKKPFLAINPYGKVPVLKDQDFILGESTAIMRYLEEKYPESKRLIPESIIARAKMNEYASQCETDFCFPGSMVYFAKKFIKEEKWDLARMKESSKKVGRHFDIMENYLMEKDFLIENKFGFLEIMYAPFIANISYMDAVAPPNIQKWIDRVLNHDAVNKVLKNVNQ